MTNKKILITGASIAGPTLGYWLHRYGFTVTIVERALSLRQGGQSIDIKGAAQKIACLMGVEQLVKNANTGELGVHFVDAFNTPKATLAKDNDKSFTAELEILRGDLANILYNSTKENISYLFGDSITAIQENEEGVLVTFQKNEPQLFDLVICADGIRSSTRSIIFGDENVIQPLQLYMAYFTIPKVASDTNWARWYNAPHQRAILLRPDNNGTTRASLSFISKTNGYEKLSTDAQKEILIEKFADAGWESPRILEALQSNNEIYFDSISQVKASTWHKGRCAMTGDAAYCPSPLSGMGASAAMVGAYILASELAKQDTYTQAFESYEKIVRPFINKIQKLPPGVPHIAHPKGKMGLFFLHTVLNIVSSKFVARIGILFSSKNKSVYDDENIILPIYDL